MSTHAFPQAKRPGGHIGAHTPVPQKDIAGQTSPQAPQFSGSESMSTHVAPHRVIPGGHAHQPPKHCMVTGHGVLQAPQ